jgi:uncharacterized membrane protein YkgB
MSAPTTSPPRLSDPGPAALGRVASLWDRAGPWLLRGSLAIVLVWFGALKVAGVPTMTSALIAAITPSFLDAGLLTVLAGAFEVALGVGLLLGRWQPLVLAGVAAQMSATFLVLALQPDVAFIDGNPLVLSVEGEYVVKNVVLLAAALTLAGPHLARRRDDTAVRPRATR